MPYMTVDSPDESHIPNDTQCASKDAGIAEALKVAVSALYFNDNSDYETALYEIVTALAGKDISTMVFERPAEAYAIYVKP